MTTLLSDERLAEIRAREQAATPGPWKDYVEHGFNGWKSYATGSYKLESTSPEVAPYQVALVEGYSRGEPTTRRQRKLDAAFIAAARQDVPDLLAEVERLRKEVLRREIALTSLTPLGSEWCNVPEKCAEFSRNERNKANARWHEWVRRLKESQAEVTRLRSRVARLEGVLRSEMWDYPEGLDRRRLCRGCGRYEDDGHAPDCELAAALREGSDG